MHVLGGRASRQSPNGLSMSRAGPSRAGSVRDPLDNINIHSPDAIEKERHYQQLYQDLKRQFEAIDRDHNGLIDKEELVAYMMEMTGNKMAAEGGVAAMSEEEQIDLEARFNDLCSNLFVMMDQGEDQKVSHEEFVDTFFEQYKFL